MSNSISLGNIFSSLFGVVTIAIGLVNMFWGNDPGFGIFMVFISFIFFAPVSQFITQKTGINIKPWMNVGLAFFILWASLGVGELFEKIDMMMHSFNLK